MTVAFVNDRAAAGNLVTSQGNTYAPTTGNLVIVVGGAFQASAIPTLTLSDTRGNSIPSPTVNPSISRSSLYVWLIPNCIGGAGTFTVTSNLSNSNINVDVYEYSGASLTAALDGTPATNTFGLTTSVSSGNLVTSFAGSLIFSAYFDQQFNHTVTHTLGGTQRLNNQNSTLATSDEMELIANAGTYSDTASWTGGNGTGEIALIGIKAAAAGGSTPLVVRRRHHRMLG